MKSGLTSKKAIQVKWDGKSIALGTFPIHESDEKCARAKELTKLWRTTMRPKPSREWVIHELEKLNVRLVSSRNQKDKSAFEPRGCDQEDQGRNIITPSFDHNNDPRYRVHTLDDSFRKRNSFPQITNLFHPEEGKSGAPRTHWPPHPHTPYPPSGCVNGFYEEYNPEREPKKHKRDKSDRVENTDTERSPRGGKMEKSFKTTVRALNAIEENLGGINPIDISRKPNEQYYKMLKMHYMTLRNLMKETKLMMDLYCHQQIQKQVEQEKLNDSQLNALSLKQEQLLSLEDDFFDSDEESLGLELQAKTPKHQAQIVEKTKNDRESSHRSRSNRDNNKKENSLEIRGNGDQINSDVEEPRNESSGLDNEKIQRSMNHLRRMFNDIERKRKR